MYNLINKPLKECTDQELLTWYIYFYQDVPSEEQDKWMKEFQEEANNRGDSFLKKVNYLDSVL